MDPSSILLSSSLQNAAVLTVVLAFAGYLVAFMSSRMLARRTDMLNLVDKRLNEFYGPLYVASQAGNIAYRSLLKKQGKTQSYPILDEEMKEWVLWMTTIFMPLNDVREKIIIEKAYLIVQGGAGQVGRRRLLRAPLHHRLAARVRWLRRALLQGPQSRADPPAAPPGLEALPPPHRSQTALSQRPVVSDQLSVVEMFSDH